MDYGFSRINRPMLFAYESALQPNADYLKAKLGSKVQLERFDGMGTCCSSTIRSSSIS